MLRWRITGFQSRIYLEFMSGWIAASLGHVYSEFINFLEAKENKNTFFLQKAAVPEVSVHSHSGWKGLPLEQTPSRDGSPWSALESRKVNTGKWWVPVSNQLQITFSLIFVGFLQKEECWLLKSCSFQLLPGFYHWGFA